MPLYSFLAFLIKEDGDSVEVAGDGVALSGLF